MPPLSRISWTLKGINTARDSVVRVRKVLIFRTPIGRAVLSLIKKIADLINEKKIEGISYINDESDRNGLRIIVILKHDAVASVVLNTLYKNTPLQTSFAVNNIALVNGRPQREQQIGRAHV